MLIQAKAMSVISTIVVGVVCFLFGKSFGKTVAEDDARRRKVHADMDKVKEKKSK